ILVIRARVRAMRHAAAFAVGRANRAGARTTGAFLLIELAGAARNLTTAQRVAGAKARIRLLAHHGLMHHRHIRLDAEDIFGELDGSDFSAGLIEDFCFHQLISSVLSVQSSEFKVMSYDAWHSKLLTLNFSLLTMQELLLPGEP